MASANSRFANSRIFQLIHVSRQMSEAAKEILKKLEEHVRYVDESALVVLKGHLVIEETLGEIISTFVFHGEHLEDGRLSFSQKVAVARSMSLDEHENGMWQLLFAINSLRNELAHSLNPPKREAKTKALIDLHKNLGGMIALPGGKVLPEHVVLSIAITFALGFLSSFLEEVRRFRRTIDEMDKIINPHRHK